MDNMYSSYSYSVAESSPIYPSTHLPSHPGANPGMSMTAAAYMQAQQQQQQNQQLPSSTTRKRHSPVLPMEAPTQPRRYITPSATSKKEIPTFFLKRRSHSQPSDEEDDELTEEPPAAGATDQEKIEWKRRQNTLAARRSRKRKLVYQKQLEETVERLTMEKEVWKTRALTLKQLLHSHHIPCPDFKD